MIALILYIVFLSTLAAMIVFILRQAVSYFKSVQTLFVAAFLSYWTIASKTICSTQNPQPILTQKSEYHLR